MCAGVWCPYPRELRDTSDEWRGAGVRMTGENVHIMLPCTGVVYVDKHARYDLNDHWTCFQTFVYEYTKLISKRHETSANDGHIMNSFLRRYFMRKVQCSDTVLHTRVIQPQVLPGEPVCEVHRFREFVSAHARQHTASQCVGQ